MITNLNHPLIRQIFNIRCAVKSNEESGERYNIVEMLDRLMKHTDTFLSDLGQVMEHINTAQDIPEEFFRAYTFDQFVEYGKVYGKHLTNGMPWSFAFYGHPVTHENDSLYLVTIDSQTVRFARGDRLMVDTRSNKVTLVRDMTREEAANHVHTSDLGDAVRAARGSNEPPTQKVAFAAEQEQGDPVCEEQDGCPIERAVLQRAWRAHKKEISPLAFWWSCIEAEYKIAGDKITDDTVVLHFMGSGASAQVTAGQLRTLTGVKIAV